MEGADDEELLNWTRAHVSGNHSDMDLTDEQIQQIVKEGAYDTPGKAHEKKYTSSRENMPAMSIIPCPRVTIPVDSREGHF